jgi:D-inositol-3-phosphate glycosyltransferase
MPNPRLLWIGDAGVSTGFARATHKTLDVLRQTYDVSVLGIGYLGDPHSYPYPIYPTYPGGDHSGIGRLRQLIMNIRPHVIVLQQDPWNFPSYLKRIENVPVIGAVAVDGKNCRGSDLNGLALAVFWTEFGKEQAHLGGYEGSSVVIPLGVDRSIYFPRNRHDARQRLGIPEALRTKRFPPDAFIVGAVGRNQLRKRLDLTISYFAEWVHSKHVDDALLWLHVAPTAEDDYDLNQLVDYYNLVGRVIVPSIEMWYGVSEELLSYEYNSFDVLLTTTQGEGFGLPAFEAMACGVPVIAPSWSALGELLREVAILIPCSTTSATPGKVNSIGGIPDREAMISELDRLYHDSDDRQALGTLGLARASEARFDWANVGKSFTHAVNSVVGTLADLPSAAVV